MPKGRKMHKLESKGSCCGNGDVVDLNDDKNDGGGDDGDRDNDNRDHGGDYHDHNSDDDADNHENDVCTRTIIAILIFK